MIEGFHVVEPVVVARFLSLQRNKGLVVSLLSWLCREINREFKIEYPGVKLLVIKVEFCGAYPCLAIDYGGKSGLDLESEVEELSARFMERGNLSDFFEYALLNAGVTWEDESSSLLK